MKSKIIKSLFTGILIISCDTTMDEANNPNLPNNGGGNNSGSWLIPKDEVMDGGPGRDGIPALANPDFKSAGDIDYLSDDDLVLGFADGDDVRAYPHAILDWHEIVNDDTPNHSLAVIYCPLTGTGIGWNRNIEGSKTTFGVSGLLYNSNIIPYDRQTNSNWSQLLLKSVNGKLSGTFSKNYNLIETTWKTWKEMYPESKVLSRNTGYDRNYDRYPYGAYKEDGFLIFPVGNLDNRMHAKARVLGVLDKDLKKAYPLELFEDAFKVVQNSYFVVVGSRDKNLMVAFDRELKDGTRLTFKPVQSELPIILKDNEGTMWDIFGRGVSGPRSGKHLSSVPYMMGYWFSFAAFYPKIAIYDGIDED